MSHFFTSGGQSIGASASASVLLMNIQGLFPLGLTGLICLQSKGLSIVLSSTTVQKHQVFSAQPSLCRDSFVGIIIPNTHLVISPKLPLVSGLILDLLPMLVPARVGSSCSISLCPPSSHPLLSTCLWLPHRCPHHPAHSFL